MQGEHWPPLSCPSKMMLRLAQVAGCGGVGTDPRRGLKGVQVKAAAA
jgi:hypothetical protein